MFGNRDLTLFLTPFAPAAHFFRRRFKIEIDDRGYVKG